MWSDMSVLNVSGLMRGDSGDGSRRLFFAGCWVLDAEYPLLVLYVPVGSSGCCGSSICGA